MERIPFIDKDSVLAEADLDNLANEREENKKGNVSFHHCSDYSLDPSRPDWFLQRDNANGKPTLRVESGSLSTTILINFCPICGQKLI